MSDRRLVSLAWYFAVSNNQVTKNDLSCVCVCVCVCVIVYVSMGSRGNIGSWTSFGCSLAS